MRRRDREVTDRTQMLDILRRCEVISVAFSGETPYVIPMSFGFEETDGALRIYLHGAQTGEKTDRLMRNPCVAFSLFTGNQIVDSGTACAYTTTYESVCGTGTVTMLDGEEKRHGLRMLMAHYAPEKTFDFSEAVLAQTCVMRIDADSLSGKRREHPSA